MLLRAARSTDAGTVGDILSAFIDDTPWMPRIHTRAEDLAHAGALIARGGVTVAEREGAVIGFAACEGDDLDALYVQADAQSTGVGSALLEAVRARRETLTLWTFEANIGAQRFYLRHGFREVRRTDGSGNDEGLPDILYEWRREAS
ncbi:N-acetyltransferase family protein [Marimonas sp. MJW-29]|uniref:N-acetyltransferase family protein n=1 Tax=Sulfitobacter sediminis TaxID=3234186 RepID=A0ABV3RKQ0_9RHOB